MTLADRLAELAAAVGADIKAALKSANNLSDLTNIPDAQRNLILSEKAKSRGPKSKGWNAVLAAAQTSRVDVVMMGPSTLEGYGQTNWNDIYPTQVRDILRAQLGISGGGRGAIAVPSQVGNTGGPNPWTITSSAGASRVNQGYASRFLHWWFTDNIGKAVLTLEKPITSFDICHIKTANGGAGGLAYYKIDGGAPVTFSVYNSFQLRERLHVALPANSTIEVGYSSGPAGSGFALDNIIEYNGDENSGLQVHNLGFSGSWAGGWVSSAGNGWGLAVALLQPDLIILDWGGNERIVNTGNRTSAQFQTDLTNFITVLRNAGITCPIQLHSFPDFSGYTGSAFVEPWANYINAQRAVAAADPTVNPPIESGLSLPSSADTNLYGMYQADKLHPSNAGARGVAATVVEGLFSDVRPMSLPAATSGGGGLTSIPRWISFSFPGSLGLYTGPFTWYNDTGQTLTITSVRASVGTAPTGAAIIVDVSKNGTTIFTTQANRPTIAVSTKTIKRTNMDVTAVADGDYLTFDIDQIGSTVAGSDLIVQIGFA